jgi:hypothetical protein
MLLVSLLNYVDSNKEDENCDTSGSIEKAVS